MYVLPELPYAYDALAPLISRETLHTHHDKHHRTYVEKTNDLAAKAGLAGRPLEEVVREAHRRGDKALFNNAAQAWNHAFFWESMRPAGGATWAVTHNMPRKAALWYILTGDTLTGTQAEQYGLVNKAVPADQLDDEVAKLVKKITRKNPVTLELAKQVYERTTTLDLPAAIDYALSRPKDFLHRPS